MAPAFREKPVYVGVGISVVKENNDAPILFASYNSSCSLQDLYHCGIGVGVVLSALASLFKIVSKDILLCGDLRKSRADNYSADKAFTTKVNALGKCTAENTAPCKAD